LGNIYDRRFRDIYNSSVFNAAKKVHWNQVNWLAEEPDGCSVSLEVRIGNTEKPDSTWSNWIRVINNKNISKALSSQYIQYRAIFNYDGKGRPRLDEIRIGYME
jgi:hypothetical protein